MKTQDAVIEIVKIADAIKALPLDTDPEDVRKQTLKLTELFGFLQDQPEAEFFEFTEEQFSDLYKAGIGAATKSAVIELTDEKDF